ncbi:ATP-binding protein [Burkholderia cenocepacia]|uniref:ATP-binding protein n=1 Tax=Burkholderia cenocepacia TaxID=95486 RepID=UPI0007621D52|nr:ATP-binding protein [Burkholderia cenocepacia]KWU24738.1 hypothetical protein AS149_31835 [Burkholderia cenocepacia]
MTNIAEVRNLKLHPMAIHTFIKAQAGSLAKALSETVMNSLDAFATTVKVTLMSHGYVVEDDGMGFNSVQEIYSWFETLGWPHDELPGNHRTFGIFGLGRAQAWAYADNTWHSNGFLMRVDVQKKGLDYELEEVEPRKGTKIVGNFYKPLSFAELKQLEQELRELVKYVSGLVSINDEIVNIDPVSEDWTFETDDAYVRIDPKAHNLIVYNGGVLVNQFWKNRYNCTGVIVTKQAGMLRLNVARNEILVNECEAWARIKATLPVMATKSSTPSKTKLSAKELRKRSEELVAQVKADELSFEEALSQLPSLLTSVYGRSVPYYDLVRTRYSCPIAFVPKSDEFGKRLSQLRLATTISTETLDTWGCKTPDEFREMVIASNRSAGLRRGESQIDADALRAVQFTAEPQVLFASLASDRLIMPFNQLTDAEKAACIAMASNARYLTSELLPILEAIGIKLVKSAYLPIEFGDCPGQTAWLSDSNTLVLRRSDAAREMAGGATRLLAFISFCLREALKEKVGAQTDEMLMTHFTTTQGLGRFTLNTMGRYVTECQKRGLPMPAKHLVQMEAAGTE